MSEPWAGLADRVAWLESQPPPAPAAAQPTPGFGLTLLPEAVLIAEGTGVVGWTKWEASRHLSGSARVALIQAQVATGEAWQRVEARPDAWSGSTRVAGVRATGSQDEIAVLSLAFVPLANDGSFEYRVTPDPDPSPAFWKEWRVWLVGAFSESAKQ